ncbi:MAG: putative lipid II flippase FtsW [Candidatus Kaelpia aquatica]|nr:putative lipid II flippase FtsW [Candidatus Kaelpia aquatica]
MQKLKWRVILLSFILISVGAVFLYSSSGIYSEMVFEDSFYYLKRQLLFMLLGLITSIIVYKVDLNKVAGHSRGLLFFGLAMLVSVLLFGIRAGGAQRWFRLGSFGIQPIEFVRIIYIIYLAAFLERKRYLYKNFSRVCLPVYSITAILMLLLILQPDFGNAIFIALISISMLYFTGIPFKFFFCTLLGAIPFISIAFWRLPYLKLRVLGFLAPWRHPESIGFQLIQSFIAIGSGRLFGHGLGLSRQKLFYLPQAHNDFIFSIVAEELGFLGALSLLLVYVFLIWNFISILSRIGGLFKRLLLTGLIISFSYQVAINIGVCLGLLPTKGCPLPFISYGGSSMIANMVLVGLILNIAKSGSSFSE